jgi:hypothetical protein
MNSGVRATWFILFSDVLLYGYRYVQTPPLAKWDFLVLVIFLISFDQSSCGEDPSEGTDSHGDDMGEGFGGLTEYTKSLPNRRPRENVCTSPPHLFPFDCLFYLFLGSFFTFLSHPINSITVYASSPEVKAEWMEDLNFVIGTAFFP